jgi:hypothetical protein
LLNARIPAMRNQALIGLFVFVFGLWLAWEIGGNIAANNMQPTVFFVLAFTGCLVAMTIVRNWRSGFYFFLVWLLFEDLVRKYMGNNLALFFGKDVLAGLVYVSLYVAVRRGREKTFRPPFLFFLSLFFWLGVLQIFNQNSPHILYGLLGFKVYFFYVPLMFVGYALIRSDEDLRKFLVVNASLAGLIAVCGIIQAIVGHSFLNPTVLAPELQDLGALDKVTPLTSQVLSLPSSVFVSAGRFSVYLILVFILMMGSAGYLLLHTLHGRKLVFIVLGVICGAALFSGSRGTVVSVAASFLIMSAGFLWGAPWRWKQAYRMAKAIRRSLIVGALGLAFVVLVFPNETGSRIALYTETLSPNSSAYEFSTRSWDYPVQNLLLAFTTPNWVVGNGIGTASLGIQYVAKVIGQRPPAIWVECGYGVLIVELGIVAPFLWILWSGALLYFMWKVMLRLRQTRFFPIAFAIFWFAFLLLYPMTFGSLSTYQNYICNAYFWLLIGIFFRLPEVLANPAVPAVVSSPKPHARRGFPF